MHFGLVVSVSSDFSERTNVSIAQLSAHNSSITQGDVVVTDVIPSSFLADGEGREDLGGTLRMVSTLVEVGVR